MKSIRSVKFIFNKEEIAHVCAVCKMLEDMDDYDYDELIEQIKEKFDSPIEGICECLNDLLQFMEEHVDLQNN